MSQIIFTTDTDHIPAGHYVVKKVLDHGAIGDRRQFFLLWEDGSFTTEPEIRVDVYEMFDLMPNIILGIMSKTTVGAKWDPLQSSLSGKFPIQHRVNARLMLGELIKIVTRHKPNRLPVAALHSQCI